MRELAEVTQASLVLLFINVAAVTCGTNYVKDYINREIEGSLMAER